LSLDAVKGVLVLLMVVYHVMSIASTADVEAFRYIRFISGSFVFLSGFIVARFIDAAFDRDPGATAFRLLARGLKIVLIFTVLNALIQISGFGNVSKRTAGFQALIENAATIYATGDNRMASFVVLLPIAYVLIIAPVFLRVAGKRNPVAAGIVLATVLSVCTLTSVADDSPVIQLVLVGIAGMCAGVLPVQTRAPEPGVASVVKAIAGLALSLWLAGKFGGNTGLYCVGVALILKFLHDGARLVHADGMAARAVVRLGRYSLICYIAQIGVIQVLFRSVGMRRWDLGVGLLALCVLTGLFMTSLCAALEALRARSGVIDRSYRFLFS